MSPILFRPDYGTDDIDGLVQDCSNPSASALELLQCHTKPSMWTSSHKCFISPSIWAPFTNAEIN